MTPTTTVWTEFANFFNVLFNGDGVAPGLNDIKFFGVSIIGYIFSCLVAVVLVNFIIKVAHK